MKEYLDPKDWSLKVIKLLLDRVPSNWIEVPEGAECAHKQFISEHKVGFYKKNHSWDHKYNMWVFEERFNPYANRVIFWQRTTQPEELPFADDEPPAYYGNAIRPKPRQRVYAVMGRKHAKVSFDVTVTMSAPISEITITGTVSD